MLTLGIETSCDETAAAVVEDGTMIRSNVIASQHAIHAAYGGVVPELACRSHIEKIKPVVDEALQEAGVTLHDIDMIGVTQGPGLIGALLVGLSMAKALAYALRKPLVAVHHLEGHMSAIHLEHTNVSYPLIALVVSGGHSDLYYCPQRGHYTILGRTRDDAAGECFDKVAKMLSLGYPGGPLIDRLAKSGDPEAFHFPRALRTKNSFDFSFSGVKTAIRTCLLQMVGPDKQLLFHTDAFWPQPTTPWWEQRCHDLLASFQAAVVDALVTKTTWAVQQTKARTLAVVGGVACNSALRHALCSAGHTYGVPVVFPSPILCTDNAAMIACAATYRYQMQPLVYTEQPLLELDAHPNLVLSNVL